MSYNDIIVMNKDEYLEKENAIELYILNNKNSLIEWCTNNYNLFNNKVFGNSRLFNIGIEFLLNKNIKYTEENNKFIITYFAKEAMKDLKLENVSIKFSNNILLSDYSCAHYDKKNKEIIFYLNKFSHLNEDNTSLLSGIMSIFTEIYRIKQKEELKQCNDEFNIEDYALILEHICSYEKEYYHNNYNKSIKENRAKLYAFDKTVSYMSIFKPEMEELNNNDELYQMRDIYCKNISDGINNRFKQLDIIATDIIGNNTYFVIEYPSLYLGYELEGNPKDLKTLSKDYKYFLDIYPNKKDNIYDFYKLLICKRFDIKEEEFDKYTNDLEIEKNKQKVRNK